jgi:hypothetical protein
MIAEQERTIEETVVITRLPATRPIRSFKSVRHRIAKPALGNGPDALKPAIALAGPMNAKIVVVSAEQVQRERAQTAHPAIRRPRPPASGPSGRRAFEALFGDQTDPARASEQ